MKVVRFVRLFYAMMVLWKNPQETLFLFPHSKNAPTKAAGAFLLLNETLEIVDDVLNFKNIADEA